MLFTEEAIQQFTSASLKIYNYARYFVLEPWPRAPSFVKHLDIGFALDSGSILDSGEPIKCITDACVTLGTNTLMFLYDQLDDADDNTVQFIRENPTIVDFKRRMDSVRVRHISVTIESSLDCRVTSLKLSFLIFDSLPSPSAA